MTKNIDLQADRPSISSSVGKTKRVNFDLSVALHQKLKRYSVEKNKSIKDILTEFVGSLPS